MSVTLKSGRLNAKVRSTNDRLPHSAARRKAFLVGGDDRVLEKAGKHGKERHYGKNKMLAQWTDWTDWRCMVRE